MIAQELCSRYRWRSVAVGAASCLRGLVVELRDICRQGVGLMPPVLLRMRIGKRTRTLPTEGVLETLTMLYSSVNAIILSSHGLLPLAQA
jgi:hypothetical protein